jgi:ketosteroid isomerase-like protein
VATDDTARFRRAFDAFSRGDLDTALADVAPDFKLRDHVIIEGTEEPSGPEAVRANHAQLLEGFDEFTLEPLEFVEIDDGMLVRILSRGHSSREGGIDVELEVGQLWRLRDGIAISLDIYPSWAEARRAAGLENGE